MRRNRSNAVALLSGLTLLCTLLLAAALSQSQAGADLSLLSCAACHE